MNKYQNLSLNNQYVASTFQKIECPFCTFWMQGSHISNAQGRIYICNNKKCRFFIQFIEGKSKLKFSINNIYVDVM
jgi:hypothetical protein